MSVIAEAFDEVLAPIRDAAATSATDAVTDQAKTYLPWLLFGTAGFVLLYGITRR